MPLKRGMSTKDDFFVLRATARSSASTPKTTQCQFSRKLNVNLIPRRRKEGGEREAPFSDTNNEMSSRKMVKQEQLKPRES